MIRDCRQVALGRVHLLVPVLILASGFLAGLAGRYLIPPAMAAMNGVEPPGEVDREVLKRMPDLDRIARLRPPADDALAEDWWAFGQELADIDRGKNGADGDYISALLPWYVYIAKHHPPTIYLMNDLGYLRHRTVSHLVAFGYLPQWMKNLEVAERYLLGSRAILRHITFLHGAERARSLYRDALYARGPVRTRFSVRNLIFYLDGIPRDERPAVLEHLLKRQDRNELKIDPRVIEDLRVSGDYEEYTDLFRKMMNNSVVGNYLSGRSMAGYMPDAARLRMKKYVRMMLEDIEDNAEQPTNFYCSACGLALVTEGMLGAGLLDIQNDGAPISMTWRDGVFILEERK